jgi:hypothetical protein
MRKIAVMAAFAVFGVISPASADVLLSLQNGRVTIVAKDATVRQILTEWARVGQTKIVNVERIPGTPLTIELRDVPEQQALGAAPSPVAPTVFSQTTPPSDEDRDDAGPPPGLQQPPGPRGPVFVFPQPQVTGAPPVPSGQPNQPQGAPPTFFPQTQPVAPTTPATVPFPGASTTSSPAGVAVPGMIVPAPAPQPGQQPAPQQ